MRVLQESNKLWQNKKNSVNYTDTATTRVAPCPSFLSKNLHVVYSTDDN